MGKFLDNFKNKVKKTERKLRENHQKNIERNENKGMSFGQENEDFEDFEEENDLMREDYDDPYDDVGIQPAQKPESFHHFILENQYKDLERSIRGFKDVFDKSTQQWRTIRKKEHCFTDEEAEEILRTAQSHLATDIKLGIVSTEAFPILMDAIYQELSFLFESIAEYRYGRYGAYEKQYEMKLQNHKIFLELFTRIYANYSRSIAGQENKLTHSSVRGQESLQNTERLEDRNMRYS